MFLLPTIVGLVPLVYYYPAEHPQEVTKVVVSFKCPTEAFSISTPGSLVLHKAVDTGFQAINTFSPLPVKLEQVCN